MNTLAKTLLGMTAALSLTLAAGTVGAGPWGGGGPGDGGPWGGGPHGGGPGGDPEQRLEMMQQRQAARLEQLRQTLQLRPDQEAAEAAWQAFVTAHKEIQPGTHWKAMQQTGGTVPAHFEKRIQFMEERLADLKTLAEAATALYAALDDNQKKAMDTFFNERPRLGRRAQDN